MDFVVGLPKCKVYGQVYNTILMIVDWLSKKRYYISCSKKNKGTSATAIANLFIQDVWSKHGLPTSLTSDQGPQFVLKIWDLLYKILEFKAKLSSAHYPETDGQSEIANQETKQHLQTYANHFQND